ncbi:hypothetical protein [Kaistia granuli]|uniref:hypothetical protein n=1 Tax=Kaistia granuli TaxID=363259 RepID=UPI0003624211|nr:hypothetical protein [Kaistia granuli]
MGTFQFETEDGRSFEIEAPDAQTATAAFHKNVPAAQSQPSTAESAIRGMGDMGFLGFADEATAGIKTGFGLLGDYGKELQAQRQAKAAAEQAHPYAFMGGQLAGAIPASVLPIGAAARGTTMLGQMARGAIGGAVQGGAYGFGSGEGGAENRLDEGMKGAGIGLAAGAAAPVVGRLAGAGLSKVMGRGGEKATQQVSRALQSDSVDPAALANMAPDEMIADLGPNLQQMASVQAASPGPGRQVVREAMAARQAGAGQRTQDAVDHALGPRTNVVQSADQIAADRASTAAPLYQQAYAAPVQVTQPIQEILATPTGRAALAKAKRLAADERAPIDVNNLDTRALDYVKRGLDDVAGALARGGRREQLRAVNDMRTTLLGEMDQMNPAYAQARAAYAGPSGVLDAMDAGKSVFQRSLSPDELRKEIAALGQAERSAFQEGARSQIEEIMATARNDAGAAARELAEKGWNREKLRILVGSKADNLIGALEKEKRYAGTANRTLNNSETATRVAGMGDLAKQTGGIRQAYESGGFLGLLRAGGLKAVEGLIKGSSDEEMRAIGEQIARQLTATGSDRTAVLAALQRVQRSNTKNKAVADKAGYLLSLTANAGGQTAGQQIAPRQPLRVDVNRPANFADVLESR